MKTLLLAFGIIMMTSTAGYANSSADSVAEPHSASDTVATAGPVTIPALFEYPVAPDNLPDIKSRGNWLMQNFWGSFDFSQPSVSQAALDHAFNVFVSPLRWADPDVAETAIDNLVKTLQKHPPMLFQFTKAAEHNLYTDRAEMWVDGAYLKFVDALLANKKISDIRKARYKAQKAQLSTSLIGGKMPPFSYVTPSGKEQKLEFTTPFTVIEFGDPFCTECAMYKVNLESFPELNRMIADGQLSIYYIVPDAESVDGWERQLAVYPSAWYRGAGKGLDEIYDMRQTPSVYLLGADGTIIDKYISSEALRDYLQNNKPQE